MVTDFFCVGFKRLHMQFPAVHKLGKLGNVPLDYSLSHSFGVFVHVSKQYFVIAG